MKASELIELLQKLIEKHGDLKVVKTGIIGFENYESELDKECISVEIEDSYFNILTGKVVQLKRIEL